MARRSDVRRGTPARWRYGAAAWAVCAGLSGCAGMWDEVTSRDFHMRNLFQRPEPLAVLRESTDGDARAKAMRALKEPRRNGGGDTEQEEVVKLLTAAAVSDPQPLCRLAAIEALGRFEDPRAVPALRSAYETAAQLPAEVAGPIQSQALVALGRTHQAAAVTFLVQTANQPMPADAGDRERQQVRDNRVAAVRALKNYEGSPEVADAMAKLAQAEKDVALRDRARETYAKVTGSEPPAGGGDAAPQSLTPPQPDSGIQLTGHSVPKP